MAVADLCREIRKLAEKDSRPSSQIYSEIMQTGAQMYFSKQWPREAVMSFCASIVRFLANSLPEDGGK